MVCYRVFTEHGEYVFYDLETAVSFARKNDMIYSDEGKMYSSDGEEILFGCRKGEVWAPDLKEDRIPDLSPGISRAMPGS